MSLCTEAKGSAGPLPSEAVRGPVSASFRFWWPQASLACGCIAPSPTSGVTSWPLLCVCLWPPSASLLGTVPAFRAQADDPGSVPQRNILNLIPPAKPRFHIPPTHRVRNEHPLDPGVLSRPTTWGIVALTRRDAARLCPSDSTGPDSL